MSINSQPDIGIKLHPCLASPNYERVVDSALPRDQAIKTALALERFIHRVEATCHSKPGYSYPERELEFLLQLPLPAQP
jgi:hypothetical protein